MSLNKVIVSHSVLLVASRGHSIIEQARLGLSVTLVTLSVAAGMTHACVDFSPVADRSPHFWTYTWVGIAGLGCC